MKLFYHYGCLALTLLATALTASAADASTERLDASVINVSVCKSSEYEMPEASASTRSYNDTGMGSIKVRYSNQVLTITWIDYLVNCCPERYESWVTSYYGDDLFFALVDYDGICDCLCPRDIITEYHGIAPGVYDLNFGSYYGYPCYASDVELQEGYEGVFGLLALPPVPDDGRVTSTETSISGCKTKGGNLPDNRKNLLGKLKPGWNISYDSMGLSVTWESIIANCLPHGFNAWYIVSEDNVLDFYIEEIYIPDYPSATCVCPFDVDNLFPEIAPGSYTFRFHDQEDKNVYEVQVELQEGFSAHYTTDELTGVQTLQMLADAPIRLLPGNVLRCEADGAYTIEIVGVDGMQPLTLKADGTSEVSVANLPAGVYIARILRADGTVSSLRFTR